ncbi:MAG: transglycosylase SLT domain-containing protein [Methylobacter sp.]|jgi:soluble lytic murein transglycosylase
MQVPVYNRQVEQQGVPDAYQTNTAVAEYKAPKTGASDFLSNDTQALSNAGASAAHDVSIATTHLYRQQLHEANQTRFKDGYTQYQKAVQQRMYGENGALNQRGIDAFQPKDGKSLLDNVGDDLSEVRSKIAETFSNDQQRQWFNEHADALDAHTQGQLLQHGAEQHRIYQRSTLDASDAVESDNISLAYNDHNSIQKSLDTINQNGLSRAKLEGLPEETGKLAAKKNASNALTSAIQSALAQGDHASATAILHKFSPDMDTNDMLKNYAVITKENDARASFGMAQNVMSTIVPRLQTSDGDRAVNILFNAESGGNHFQGKFYGLRPDGTPKGTGYLGELKRPDGGVMTEYSIGVKINDKEMDIPTIVPTLSKDEVNHLLNTKEGDKLPDSIVQKAVDHAESRIKQGLSVWHDTPQPITSSKGAVGIAQVMPDTGPEAAKLAGLDWDENRFRNDPEYNKALGTAYFNQQLKSFGADLGMAYAAYNAGPGATQDAVEKAGKEGGNWLSYLPQETQAYVTNNMNAYAAGEGQYKRPTLAEAHAVALEHIGPNASPNLRKQVLDEVANQYEEQTKAIKQREEESTAEAMRQLLQNGGKFSALPVNIRASVPPNQVDNLMNFGKKVSEGEPIATDWSLYYRLKTDPALLKNTNLMAFRDKLNDTEFKQLTGEQQSAANSSHTETRSAKDILQNFMREAGVDPTPKDDDAKGAATVGKIWSAFDQRISDAEQEKGKKLNAEEIQKVAAQMFTKVGVKAFLYGTDEKPAILIDTNKDKVIVPADERAQIINAWRTAKPGQQITEDDIFTMYARHKGLL